MKNLYFLVFAFFFCVNSISGQSASDIVVAIGDVLVDMGYEVTHDLEYASLNKGELGTYPLELESNIDYMFYVLCDGACGDLEICLIDEDKETTLKCDEGAGGVHYIEASPRNTATYGLQVQMVDCGANPCRFGIAVFGK